MISTCQPRAVMYSARLNAARIVPPMFQAVHSTMIRRRSPSSRAGTRTARSSTPRISLVVMRFSRCKMGGHGTRWALSSRRVPWKETINGVLTRATGYQLQRAGTPAAKPAKPPRRPRIGEARAGDRLVEAPVFVICTLRSGSTLLRVLLDSHSAIRSPHELHLRYVSVHFDQKWSERSMAELGLDTKGAEYLLWDRLLHRELAASGKRIIADKTPNNVFIVDRLRESWPDARFIFLLRHPAAIARSRQNVRGERADDDEKNVVLIRRYCEALEAAR